MSINDRDRTYLTNTINIFMIYFQRTLKANKATDLINAFFAIEECIDSNTYTDINIDLPAKIEEAKIILVSTPKITHSIDEKRNGVTVSQAYNVNAVAKDIINKIESITPPHKQYARPASLSKTNRNESADSLTSMTTNPGGDERTSLSTPILTSFILKKTSSDFGINFNESDDMPCYLCTIS